MDGIGGAGISFVDEVGAPAAAFSADVVLGEAPLDVTFTDDSTGVPTSWRWSFGDGATSNAQNPMHTYAAAGYYTVTLVATNANGDTVIVKKGYIHAVVPVVADFVGDPLVGTDPTDVDFTDLSTGNPTAWHWEKNDGGGWVDFDGTPTVQNPTETFTVGSWSVRLTASKSGSTDTHTEADYVVIS